MLCENKLLCFGMLTLLSLSAEASTDTRCDVHRDGLLHSARHLSVRHWSTIPCR